MGPTSSGQMDTPGGQGSLHQHSQSSQQLVGLSKYLWRIDCLDCLEIMYIKHLATSPHYIEFYE